MEHVTSVESPYQLLLRAALLIPISHYLFGFCFIAIVVLYHFLEMHFFQDLFTGFRGQPVKLSFNPSSQLYRDIVSECKILHGRYLATPWLCSPHLQTLFIHIVGKAPVVNYRRQLLKTDDGGTLALDWVINEEVKKQPFQENDAIERDVRNPIVLIIPGLTTASSSAYVRNLAFNMAKNGWDVVVSNHRGLGGVPITSDCFYHGGWTKDIRKVIDHLHCQYPEAPIFVVGASLGANMMVDYLGEDGKDVPIIGAAAVCSPWDLLLCDRFINRRFVQRLYNKALAAGLKKFAFSHKAVVSRLANLEGIEKARRVRDYDDSATRLLCHFETVDTYYRRITSCNFVGKVMVPLLCISSLDDPVCASEAIPWDECRLNKNVILATTQHGGHLPFFEGLTANSNWWVRAVEEYFKVLHSNTITEKKIEVEMPVSINTPLESSSDHAPYAQDSMVNAVNDEVAEFRVQYQENGNQTNTKEVISVKEIVQENENLKSEIYQTSDIIHSHETDINNIFSPVKKHFIQLSRENRNSMWFLAYIAIVTGWPVLGSALYFLFWK